MAAEERKAFVPGFQEDVFLSFAHVNNGDGWVADLHSQLEIHFKDLLGRNFRIWRDPRMHPGDVLDETLERTIEKAAVFVSILSPGYLQSPTCLMEARHFSTYWEGRNELLVDTTCRLVQVIKVPFEHSPEARFLDDLGSLQCRFYEKEEFDESRIALFHSQKGQPRYADFYDKAEDLAQSLAGILQKMKAKRAPREPAASRVRVFLAEATSDRRDDRAFVVNEIADRCELVESAGLPPTLEELAPHLAGQLAGCALSVHLLGSRFGVRPEGEEARSLPGIQLDAAAGTGVRRLVWIPDTLVAVEPDQQRFLAAVESRGDADLEVVKNSRQAFVQHLEDVLEELSQPPKNPILGKAIYVVSDPQDLVRPQLKALRNCILSQGFRVELPVFEGDVEELHRAEEQALRDTNATLIYYGAARDVWVRARRMEILKALATLEGGSNYRRALYLCTPETPTKRATYMDLPGGRLPEMVGPPLLVLGDCGEFACEKLAPLLQSLGQDDP